MNARGQLACVAVLGTTLAVGGLVRAQETENDIVRAPVQESQRNTQEPTASKQTGLAAFYHTYFHGQRTANGESFDQNGLTAAHKSLPFGTLVRVTNLRNNKSIIVRVNDRGPMHADRVIDVTRRAATVLGFLQQGMTRVDLEILPPGAANK